MQNYIYDFSKLGHNIKPKEKRGTLTRIFDLLSAGTYVSAGLARGLNNSDARNTITPLGGIWGGLKAANPFGSGYDEGRHTYSKLLEDSGWKPDNLGGKIARGAVGFLGDVFLDPVTYLTGGVAGVVKGTGKTGVKASHAAVAGIDDITKGLTKEAAEAIIRKKSLARNLVINADDVATDADKLVKEFNRIIGLREPARDLRLSLSGAPFGDKIFGKNASKIGVTLVEGRVMQEIGEASLAPAYAKVRNAVYGGELGKLFSTKSKLYKLSQSDPGAVFDTLKAIEHTRGLTKNMKLMKKMVNEKARIFESLTPDESRELKELMEDKSAWSRVQKLVKLSDTQDAIVMRKKIEGLYEKTKIQVDDLLDVKKSIDTLQFAKSEELIQQTEVLDSLKQEAREQLINLKTSHIKDRKQIRQTLKVLEDEIASMQLEMTQSNIAKGFKEVSPEEVTSKIDNYRNAVLEQKAYKEKHKALLKQKEIKDAIPIADKKEVIESISEYIYGRPDYLGGSTWDGYVDTVADMIKKGDSKEVIEAYIESNIDFFSGRASMMYPYIGKKVGYGKGMKYKNWDEMYNARVREFNANRVPNTPLSKYEEGLLLELQHANANRQYWKSKFNEAITVEDVKKIITEDDVHETRKVLFSDEAAEARRAKFYDEDKAIDLASDPNTPSLKSRKTGEFADKPVKGQSVGKILTTKDRITVYDDLAHKIYGDNPKIDPKKLSRKHAEWVSRVQDQIEPLLVKHFKMDYRSVIEDGKLDKLYDLAIKDANNYANQRPLISDIAINEKRRITADIIRRNQEYRTKAMAGRIKEGLEVHYSKAKKAGRGVIQSLETSRGGKKYAKILKSDGGIEEVLLHDILGVKANATIMTVEDYIKFSDATKEFVQRQDDLLLKVSESRKLLEGVDASYKTSYDNIIGELKSKASDVKRRITELEMQKQLYQENLEFSGADKIDELTAKITEIEDALANDDAFETFVRADIGDGEVDKIIRRNSPNTFRIILNSNATTNEKIKGLAQILRDDLVKMGFDEVDINKLKFEQLDYMAEHYFPHILNEDGKRLFAKNEEILKKFPSWGDDLGYGKEFNPFAMSRTIKRIPDGNGGWINNPNVIQLNEFLQEEFGDILKGKNAFSENVADIYLTRALKNTKLMYDDEYMNTMLNVFGNEFTGVVDEGYEAVMNYGKLKEKTFDVAQTRLQVRISNSVSDYISRRDVIKGIQERVQRQLSQWQVPAEDVAGVQKRLFADEIKRVADEYVSENFTDVIRKERRIVYIEDFLSDSQMSGALDDLAVPMVNVNSNQYDGMLNGIRKTQEDLLTNIRGREVTYGFDLFGNELKKPRGGLVSYYKNKMVRELGQHVPDEKYYEIMSMSFDDTKKFINELMENADEIDMERLNGFKKKIEQYEKLGDVQVRQVNEAIVQKANQSRMLQIAKDQSKFLQMYDKFTHFIKLNQTTVLPSFHMRNKINNTFNSWLEIGADAFSLDYQKKALQAVRNKGDVQGALKITHADGTLSSIEWRDLYQEALDHDVFTETFFAADIGVGTTSAGMLDRFGVAGKFDPTNTKDFRPYKIGAAIGGTVEGQDRLIHFASQVSRGMSFEEAAESTAKHLFDYSDLTAFEQSVMKRIIPYYTWLRKNVPLQLDMMLKYPEKYQRMTKIQHGVEGMVNEEDKINRAYVADFAQDWIQTPFEVDDEPILWNPNLAYQDLNRVPDPFDLVGSAKNIFTQLNPIIKTPIEQILNKNVFFDSPIVKPWGASPTTQRAEHILSQLAMYGVGKGFATKRGSDLGLHTLNTTSGVKGIAYDYENFKSRKISELNKKRDIANQVRR